MMTVVSLVGFLLVMGLPPLAHSAVHQASQDPPRCPGGAPNTNAVNDAPPVFVASVPNGKRFVAGVGNDTFHVAHLWGTPYEQGVALGQLFKPEVAGLIESFVDYIASEIDKYVPWFPPQIAELIAADGGWAALQYIWDLDVEYMPRRYVDELDGIAEGSGVNVSWIRGMNMLPELTRAACSIFGSYGRATADDPTARGDITHLRSLDFMVDCPILNNPAVTVYHDDTGEPALANFGWIGMTGVLTGLTSARRGIGEKRWKGPERLWWVAGEPWMYLLRDVAVMTGPLNETTRYLQEAKKTTDIHVGVGSHEDKSFLGYEIAPNHTRAFTWDTLTPTPYHVDYRDLVYWERDVGAHTYCYTDLLNVSYGSLSAEFYARTLAPMARTGETHVAAFDYRTLTAYFSNCRKTNVTQGPAQAYLRPLTKLNMSALFSEQRP